MSSRQRTKCVTKKGLKKSPTRADKRQKVSHVEFHNEIIPVTATTRSVLLMKSNSPGQAPLKQLSLVSLPPVIWKNGKPLNNKIIGDMDKYSPKNIKLPSAASRTPNSSGIINVSQMSKYSPENIQSPCSSSVSLDNNVCKSATIVGRRPKILRPDVAVRQRKSSGDIISATKNTTNDIGCNKFEEDDSMVLFFKSLLPYTAGLTEEQKTEFKTSVVQWFKSTVSASLETLLD